MAIHGKCHICGLHGQLSFEHVPPRAAFNDRPIVLSVFDELLSLPPGATPQQRRTQQRGAGRNTLCTRCNNDTGRWYGPAYVRFCTQAMEYLVRGRGATSLAIPFWISPLEVAKQIVTMFMSANGSGFGTANPDLVRFILNRHQRHLPHRYRLFAFMNTSRRIRSFGVTARATLGHGTSVLMSEIDFPPFGFVLTLDSPAPDPRLVEISSFASYLPRDWHTKFLRLPLLPVAGILPGDYRTADQISREASIGGDEWVLTNSHDVHPALLP